MEIRQLVIDTIHSLLFTTELTYYITVKKTYNLTHKTYV